MTKSNKFLLLSTSIFLLVGCSSETVSKENVDTEAAPVVSEEMMTPLEGDAKSTDYFWGQCRDACYNARTKCFEVGGNTETCEQLYDDCTDKCNEIR